MDEEFEKMYPGKGDQLISKFEATFVEKILKYAGSQKVEIIKDKFNTNDGKLLFYKAFNLLNFY